MAEALTLIGGLAAIMQLAGSMVKLTKELRVCVRTIRSAPKEIRYFMLETSIFTDQLCYFHDVAKESAAVMNENSKAKRAELVQKILRQYNAFEYVLGATVMALEKTRRGRVAFKPSECNS
ncbi:hypothetical protein F4774DRAFT_61290 [Daldinia eschscholtzii]|nr:hypothetical protein F4774DRAFT_61290 [Daldinia eschscholtzii]